MGLHLKTCLSVRWKLRGSGDLTSVTRSSSGGCILNQAVIITGVGFIISASTIYRRHNTNAVNRLFFAPDISGFFKKESIKC